jgi:hypothetical protein
MYFCWALKSELSLLNNLAEATPAALGRTAPLQG